jgi:hypothetical protein
MRKQRLWNGIQKYLININRILKATILIQCCILYISCSRANKWNGYDPSELEIAWEKKDSIIIKSWIMSLTDTSITDKEFYRRVSDLSNVTGFFYGNEDTSDSVFLQTSKDERSIERKNITTVYFLYSESCLFMKNINWDNTLKIQNEFWKTSAVFNKYEIKRIREMMGSLCDN